jgi:hypothetical protein
MSVHGPLSMAYVQAVLDIVSDWKQCARDAVFAQQLLGGLAERSNSSKDQIIATAPSGTDHGALREFVARFGRSNTRETAR